MSTFTRKVSTFYQQRKCNTKLKKPLQQVCCIKIEHWKTHHSGGIQIQRGIARQMFYFFEFLREARCELIHLMNEILTCLSAIIVQLTTNIHKRNVDALHLMKS